MFDVSFSGVSSDNRGRILGVALLLMTLLAMSESLANALETYVRKPDASFAWKRTEQKKIKDLAPHAPRIHFADLARALLEPSLARRSADHRAPG